MPPSQAKVKAINHEDARKILARRILARRSLLHFITQLFPGYLPGWVHRHVAQKLQRFYQAVKEKQAPRLMLLLPPRTGKSTLASIYFPAWALGQDPSLEFMVVGYNTDLPIAFSRKARELVSSPPYKVLFPDAALDDNAKAVDYWRLKAGGGYRAVGVTAGQTGHGAHFLIIDDPIKNIEEADSALVRTKLYDWYQSTAYPRLAPGGGVLLIQTCWHYDDLAGRLLEAQSHGGDRFEVIRYPAIAEEYEYLTQDGELLRLPAPASSSSSSPLPPSATLVRSPGEALHPERYGLEELKRIRANLQPRLWAALYQQRPAPEEGALFTREMLRYTPGVSPSLRSPYRALVTVDFAVGLKQQNDFSVIASLLQDSEDTLYVAHVEQFKVETHELIERLFSRLLALKGSDVVLGVEDGTIWRAIKPLFQRRQRELRCYVPLRELKPLTDKVARARPLQGRMQQHKVVFPKDAPWLPAATEELLAFPAGVHDDIVDALAWGVQLAMALSPPRAPSSRTLPPWLRGVIHNNTSHMAA